MASNTRRCCSQLVVPANLGECYMSGSSRTPPPPPPPRRSEISGLGPHVIQISLLSTNTFSGEQGILVPSFSKNVRSQICRRPFAWASPHRHSVDPAEAVVTLGPELSSLSHSSIHPGTIYIHCTSCPRTTGLLICH